MKLLVLIVVGLVIIPWLLGWWVSTVVWLFEAGYDWAGRAWWR